MLSSHLSFRYLCHMSHNFYYHSKATFLTLNIEHIDNFLQQNSKKCSPRKTVTLATHRSAQTRSFPPIRFIYLIFTAPDERLITSHVQYVWNEGFPELQQDGSGSSTPLNTKLPYPSGSAFAAFSLPQDDINVSQRCFYSRMAMFFNSNRSPRSNFRVFAASVGRCLLVLNG